MADIISVGKLSDARLAELAEIGVDLKSTVSMEELELSEPGFNEKFVFHAEPDEVALYVELHKTTKAFTRMNRDLLGDFMTKLGHDIKQSDSWFDEIKEQGVKPDLTEEQQTEFFRLWQKRNFLHALLYWKIGERGNLHAWRLGMRKPSRGEDKLRIVKIERRLESEFGHSGHM